MFFNSVRTSGVEYSGCLYASGLVLEKCSTLCIPPVWGMFVYSDETSMDAKRQLFG